MELRQRTKPSHDKDAAKAGALHPAGSSDDSAHSDEAGGPADPLDFPGLRDYPHMPSRLRHLLSDPTIDVTSRICRDVVVRLPIVGASEGDVMAIAAHFGDAEYVGLGCNAAAAHSTARRMARSFGTTGQPQQSATPMGQEDACASSPEEGDPYCHYIRFVEGRDAIRCVLQLNGTVIDPAVHKKTLENIGDLVEAECVKATQRAEAENGPSPADAQHDDAQLWKDLSDAVKDGQAAKNDIVCADPGARVVIVTCDFFRSAFLEHPGTARLNLLISDGGPRRPMMARSSAAGAKVPTTNPLKQHQFALFVAGMHLERWYQRLLREALIPFEDFAFAVNYFTLFFEHDASALVPSLGTRLNADDVSDVATSDALPMYRPWVVVYFALTSVEFRVEVCLSWLDIAGSEAELWQGKRGSVASNHSSSSRRRKGTNAVMSKAKGLLMPRGAAGSTMRPRAIVIAVVVLATLLMAAAAVILYS